MQSLDPLPTMSASLYILVSGAVAKTLVELTIEVLVVSIAAIGAASLSCL